MPAVSRSVGRDDDDLLVGSTVVAARGSTDRISTVRCRQIERAAASGVEEEKALALAKRRLAEAREKLKNVNKWIRELDRNIPIYRGRIRKMADSVEVGVPNALAHLDRLLDSLDSYVSLAPQAAEPPVTAIEDAGSMARGGEAEEPAAGDAE